MGGFDSHALPPTNREVVNVFTELDRFAAGFAIASRLLAATGEIRACVHKNTGAVRIVTGTATCNSNNENPLSWNVAAPSGGFRVLDSADHLVGPLVDFDFVVNLIDGHWFALNVDKTGFKEAGVFYLYESTDCSGQAYIEYNNGLPEWGVSSLGGGSSLTLYYAGPSIVPRTIQSSRAVFSSGAPQPCLGPLNFAGVLVGTPATATVTASPPFRLVN